MTKRLADCTVMKMQTPGRKTSQIECVIAWGGVLHESMRQAA
ncbi:MAG TPA: hypothetical protein VKF14_01210 [Candidatus Dormibacteraeota bacterium]|nr:hypothetical protein [Candidatus Dormibacteraeota bacterium]